MPAITLLYLHGVSDGDLDGSWRSSLQAALERHGGPSLDGIHVVAPRYASALDADPSPSAKGHRHTSPKNSDADRRNFERERARLEILFQQHLDSGTSAGADVHGFGQWLAPGDIVHAHRYVKDQGLRNHIVGTILDVVPQDGEVVVIGHSLGSLIAIDLLDHLPSRVTVRRLITLGSPAGHPHMHADTERLLRDFPYSRVRGWVNVWSPWDVVPMRAGVGALFRQALDLRVALGFGQHAASSYLSHEVVAKVVIDALTQTTRSSATKDTTLEPRLTDAEQMVMMALRYGNIVHNELPAGDVRQRYEGALLLTQERVCTDLITLRLQSNSSIPPCLTRTRDGAIPPVTKPAVVGSAIAPLVAICGTNVIAPFEIDVEAKVRRQALKQLATALDLSPSSGSAIFDAMEEAKQALSPRAPRMRWAVGAAGLAVLLAAPVGLIVAAPAGLAGGAAIISALAGFGPGGMIGGLMTAGALTSTGMGMTAAALAGGSAAYEVTEAAVVQQLAHAIARRALAYERTGDEWLALSRLHSELVREQERLTAFSDDNALGLKEVKKKIDVVERALRYMIDRDVAPALSM